MSINSNQTDLQPHVPRQQPGNSCTNDEVVEVELSKLKLPSDDSDVDTSVKQKLLK